MNVVFEQYIDIAADGTKHSHCKPSCANLLRERHEDKIGMRDSARYNDAAIGWANRFHYVIPPQSLLRKRQGDR